MGLVNPTGAPSKSLADSRAWKTPVGVELVQSVNVVGGAVGQRSQCIRPALPVEAGLLLSRHDCQSSQCNDALGAC